MKQYYFISGLPRSGSTLLSGILRQNPDFYADISSPVESLVDDVIRALSGSENNFNINEEQRKNTIIGIFEGYYQHIEKPVIFDSCRAWTRKTFLIKELFPYTKILCPVRDIVSILNSFEVISLKNSFYSKKDIENSENVFVRCDYKMETSDGTIGEPWTLLQEGYAASPKMIYFIEYENLCKNPEKTMRGIYEFLEKPYYFHDFENVEYSNENFDKACNLIGLHTVKKKVEYNPPRCVLPPEIVKRYTEMNMEFWRKNNNFNKKNIEYK